MAVPLLDLLVSDEPLDNIVLPTDVRRGMETTDSGRSPAAVCLRCHVPLPARALSPVCARQQVAQGQPKKVLQKSPYPFHAKLAAEEMDADVDGPGRRLELYSEEADDVPPVASLHETAGSGQRAAVDDIPASPPHSQTVDGEDADMTPRRSLRLARR